MTTNDGAKGAPVLLLPFLVVLVTCQELDYCKLCEKPGQHTMCKYPNEAIVPPCTDVPISEIDIPETGDHVAHLGILTFVNVLRNGIAQGNSRFKLPKAANMHALLWHTESAEIAQRWAEQCQLSHDECRDAMIDTGVVEPFAQNIGELEAPSSTPTIYVIQKILQAWENEGDSFQESQLDSYVYSARTEKFTNLIWGYAHLIGCGRVILPSQKKDHSITRLICNIGPSVGNESKPVYVKGEPRTKCIYEKYIHAPDFEGLCTTVRHKDKLSSAGKLDIRFNKYVYILLLVVHEFNIVLYFFLTLF